MNLFSQELQLHIAYRKCYITKSMDWALVEEMFSAIVSTDIDTEKNIILTRFTALENVPNPCCTVQEHVDFIFKAIKDHSIWSEQFCEIIKTMINKKYKTNRQDCFYFQKGNGRIFPNLSK